MVENAKRGVMMNALIVSFIHYKMGTVTPMVMTAAMGLVRFLDDPQVKLHVLGHKDEGDLQRPFKSDNPLAKLLGLGPQPAADQNGPNAEAAAGGSADGQDDEEEEVVEEIVEEVEYVEEDEEEEEDAAPAAGTPASRPPTSTADKKTQ
mmetsp:Transcript_28534/g.69452  ORF Transcript_28534/g.69452 Transcript_28534/m.69452 type:complete len:149 (-) Transcript_28534:26-472(-)